MYKCSTNTSSQNFTIIIILKSKTIRFFITQSYEENAALHYSNLVPIPVTNLQVPDHLVATIVEIIAIQNKYPRHSLIPLSKVCKGQIASF